MKDLRLKLGNAFSPELKEEMEQLTMAGRWWLAHQLSGNNPKVQEALFADAETTSDDGDSHRLAVFEDGSCINWHEGQVAVYFDISDLMIHYEVFRPDRTTAFEEALLDYPAIEKYRKFLTSGADNTTDEEGDSFEDEPLR
jgi:hypothetical protein